jgi:hypothetical protein
MAILLTPCRAQIVEQFESRFAIDVSMFAARGKGGDTVSNASRDSPLYQRFLGRFLGRFLRDWYPPSTGTTRKLAGFGLQ